MRRAVLNSATTIAPSATNATGRPRSLTSQRLGPCSSPTASRMPATSSVRCEVGRYWMISEDGGVWAL